MHADLSVADERGTGTEAEAAVEHAPVLDRGIRDALARMKLPPQDGDFPTLEREDETIRGNRHIRVRHEIRHGASARHDREAGTNPSVAPRSGVKM